MDTKNREGLNITLAAGGISYAGTEEPVSLVVFGIVAVAMLVQDYFKTRLAIKNGESSDT